MQERELRTSRLTAASVVAVSVCIVLALVIVPARRPPGLGIGPSVNGPISNQPLGGPPLQPVQNALGVLGQVSAEDILTEGAPFNILEIRCVDVDTGEVFPGVRLLVFTAGEGILKQTTDGKGVARFRLHLAREYTVAVSASRDLKLNAVAGNPSGCWGRANVDMSGHMGDVLGVDFQVTRGVNVAGRVLLPNGAPLTDAVSMFAIIGRESIRPTTHIWMRTDTLRSLA
jgi:hypothetical protein